MYFVVNVVVVVVDFYVGFLAVVDIAVVLCFCCCRLSCRYCRFSYQCCCYCCYCSCCCYSCGCHGFCFCSVVCRCLYLSCRCYYCCCRCPRCCRSPMQYKTVCNHFLMNASPRQSLVLFSVAGPKSAVEVSMITYVD